MLDLAEVGGHEIELVGGKAAGLAQLIAAGERVPAGFCITTAAHQLAMARPNQMPPSLHEQIVRAYERLGAGPVAVRSSATAEDLPQASFAGQHETILDVDGTDELIDAVTRCWASLSSSRAIAYRAAVGMADDHARMAVVVQRMVAPQAAGVLFTANPITGTRTEMVVDAVAGLGDVVVDGSAPADHYVIGPTRRPTAGGCLGTVQLDELHAAGVRIARRAGAPHDIEWAFDHAGNLWLLQARPITTLFPLPATAGSEPRVYLEAGHMQGMLRPFTPMGMSAMRVAAALWFGAVGIHADQHDIDQPDSLIVDAAGRMFLDLTPFVRSSVYRRQLPSSMRIYGPRVVAALDRVLDDPRFAPNTRLPFRLRTAARVVIRLAPAVLAGVVRAVVAPAAARRAALRAAADIRRRAHAAPTAPRSAHQHLQAAVDAQGGAMMASMMAMLPPLYTALIAKAAATALLAGIASSSEVDETLRGMPHNVTTRMDLDLWAIAAGAREHRDLLVTTPPAELARQFLAGELPEIGLTAFLRSYGHRSAAEIDVGVPRWAEDPTAVFAALAGYLRLTDPQQTPDRRFAQAAADATAKIDQLVRRARRAHPVRAVLVGVVLRRSRALAGLRELPKFAWLHAFTRMRVELLAAGADLQRRGLLERADDIMFLDITEAHRAADGTDMRDLVIARRRDHQREMHRRTIPGLMLSDGTIPEAVAPTTPAPDGALTGMAAAPGRATGRARVILDPTGAHVEPGEILVAPTTDPGWTPLFLTAAGLVTETGAAMAHGPTVAREYGIPAVICVRDATHLITTGQTITIDGAAGTVLITESDGPVEARPGEAPDDHR
ncbi:PEP/pyruvate-binding domain-containing protein [Actinomycetes bacterium KLBMP 9759]